MPATAATWTLAGLSATARTHETDARLDLAAPRAGLAVGTDHLLGVDLRAPDAAPADHWTRGADLTAIYEPRDARHMRATAMWRVHPASVAAWELVVSAQTALLHADAALSVLAEAACAEAVWAVTAAGSHRWRPLEADGALPADAAFVLARRRGSSAVVAVHPQDPRRIEVRRGAGRVTLACGIFPAAIEKGVILRSRVLAAVGPAADDEAWAADLCAAFAASPPFLDT